MTKKIFGLLSILLWITFFFSSLTEFASAQSCSGSPSCEFTEWVSRCDSDGSTCSSNRECGLGGTCESYESVVDSTPGSCVPIVSAGYCEPTCPTQGRVGSGCSYRPPPPTYVPQEPEDPETSTTGYECVGNGTASAGCYPSATGTNYYSCMASCSGPELGIPITWVPPQTPDCPSLLDHNLTTTDIVWPGQTIYWQTWAAPNPTSPSDLVRPELWKDDNQTWNKMLGRSTEMKTVKYTSPQDYLTIALSIHPADVRSHWPGFYIYNSSADTWAFYQGTGLPAVIFTARDEIVNQLKEVGYQVIEQAEADAMSYDDSFKIRKRVFRVEQKPKNWSPGQLDKVPRGSNNNETTPYSNSTYVPWVSCADVFNASDHSRFVLQEDIVNWERDNITVLTCTPRGAYLKSSDHEDVLPPGSFGTGAYSGMSDDLVIRREAMADLIGKPFEEWFPNGILPPLFTELDNDDYDEMFFSIMPKGNDEWWNAYMLQYLMLYPKAALNMSTDSSVDQNEFQWIVSPMTLADPPYKPTEGEVIDGENDENCPVKESIEQFETYEMLSQDSSCSDLIIKHINTDGSTTTIASGQPIIPGENYQVTTEANGKIWYPNITNNLFEQFTVSDPTAGWNMIPVSNFNSFEIEACGLNCPEVGENTEGTNDFSLSYSVKPGTAAEDASVASDWFDAHENLDNVTVTVDFDMRAENSGMFAIPRPRIQRAPTQDLTSTTYREITDPSVDDIPLVFLDWADWDSPLITGGWRHYQGTATFEPAGNGNISSKMRVVFKGLESGTKVYVDNVRVKTTKQPEKVVFIARPVLDGCSIANQYSEIALPVTDPDTGIETGYFSVDNFSLPVGSDEGDYYLFAKIAPFLDNSGGGCYGHPSYNPPSEMCGTDLDPELSVNCSATCMTEVSVQSCPIGGTPAPSITTYNDLCNSSYSVRVNIPESVRDTGGKTVDVMVFPQRTDLNQNDPYDQEVLNSLWDSAIQTKTVSVPTGASYINVSLSANPSVGAFTTIAARINLTNCYSSDSDWGIKNRNLECTMGASALELTDPDGACSVTNTVGSGLPTEPYTKGLVTFDWEGSNLSDPNDSGSSNKTLENGKILLPAPTLPYKPSTSWVGDFSATLDISDADVPEDEQYVCANCQGQNDSKQCFEEVTSVPGSYTYFYVTKANLNYSSWWQTIGGLIFADTKLSSEVPINDDGDVNASCDNYAWCKQHTYINADPSSGGGPDKKAGIPITNDDEIITKNGSWWADRSPSDTAAYESGSKPTPDGSDIEVYDYQFFFDLLEPEGQSTDSSITFETMSDSELNNHTHSQRQLTDSNGNNISGSALFNFSRPGDKLTINLNQTTEWDVGDQKIVILVDGDVDINQVGSSPGKDLIDIDDGNNGGFLMIVASGDITFDADIGYDCDSDDAGLVCLDNNRNPQIEGIFIATDDLIIDSYGSSAGSDPDRKFVAAGTFVGWNNVDLPRKFDNNDIDGDPLARQKNAVSPVEQIFFRPDLVANTPYEIRTPTISWEEAN